MRVPVQYFVIRANDPQIDVDELNRFTASRRVLSIEKQFVDCGLQSFWSICVDYLDAAPSTSSNPFKRKGIDYREVLSETDFAIFSKLRDYRKQVATAAAVPVYTIFTNEHLAAIVEAAPKSLQDLQQVRGIGEAKVRDYGQDVLRILQNVDLTNETPQ